MYLHVLATDFDGTLTEDGKVAEETWNALWDAKSKGLTIILVTGRRLEALTALGPFDELCKAIVAENGAVVYLPDSEIILYPFGHLPAELLTPLQKMDIPLELGSVIAATWVPHDIAVMDLLSKTRSPATIEYNKGAVMLLPPGATKGTGLLVALQELGYSSHNVVACGDGENDRSFFEQAEVSVAVANATPELKKVADVVLTETNGKGVRSLIKDLIDEKIPISGRNTSHLLTIGKSPEGAPFRVNPLIFTQENLAIVGSSGSGKSWMAGLIAEKLLEREHQIIIVDPEGDYSGIRAFPKALLLGGSTVLPPPVEQVITLIEYTHLSLIIDLSLNTLEEKTNYLTALLQSITSLRLLRGKPHWLLIDEAHYFCFAEEQDLTRLILKEMQNGGVGIVSYRPSLLAPSILDAIDNWMITHLKDPEELELLCELVDLPCNHPTLKMALSLSTDKAIVYLKETVHNQMQSPQIVEYQTSQRGTPHVRHLRKYLRAPLPVRKRFYFNISGLYSGPRSAASLWEFLEALSQVPLQSLQYHLEQEHFENWLIDVLHETELARQMRKMSRRGLSGELLRKELIDATRKRYEELESLI